MNNNKFGLGGGEVVGAVPVRVHPHPTRPMLPLPFLKVGRGPWAGQVLRAPLPRLLKLGGTSCSKGVTLAGFTDELTAEEYDRVGRRRRRPRVCPAPDFTWVAGSLRVRRPVPIPRLFLGGGQPGVVVAFRYAYLEGKVEENLVPFSDWEVSDRNTYDRQHRWVREGQNLYLRRYHDNKALRMLTTVGWHLSAFEAPDLYVASGVVMSLATGKPVNCPARAPADDGFSHAGQHKFCPTGCALFTAVGDRMEVRYRRERFEVAHPLTAPAFVAGFSAGFAVTAAHELVVPEGCHLYIWEATDPEGTFRMCELDAGRVSLVGCNPGEVLFRRGVSLEAGREKTYRLV